MASSVFGRPITKADKLERFVGKELTLGCGYGLGAKSFGVRCKLNGIDLASLNTTPEACIKAYRERHKLIKQLWYRLNNAAMETVKSGSARDVACIHFEMRGQSLAIVLPSGRPIMYRNAAVEMHVPMYCKLLGLPEVAKECVVFTHPRGYRKETYGGMYAENVSSGICRDLLAVSLVRCESDGLPACLHVHDEIVCEVETEEAETRLKELAQIMIDLPAWARGFPIAVEGFVSPRYVKSPFKGYARCEYSTTGK